MIIKQCELVDFISLSYDEKVMILKWRNHFEIKKWMYTTEDITLNNHLTFIENLKFKKSNKQYFVVKKSEEYIGVINFININTELKECEFGLYANPFNNISGIGRLLEEICIEYVFKNMQFQKLKLEVFSENMQVRNLHKKYKFHEKSTKIINNKKVICMELKNEDR